ALPERGGAGGKPRARRPSGRLRRGVRQPVPSLHRRRATRAARRGAAARLPRHRGWPAWPALRRRRGRKLAPRVRMGQGAGMNRITRVRVCAMMFLEFFIWGGWFVTMGSYLAANLHASGAQTALAYSTQSWGAIIAPFIVGLIADRYCNAERLLGMLHLA